MHPEVSLFPREYFYKGVIQDGISAADRCAEHHQQVCFRVRTRAVPARRQTTLYLAPVQDPLRPFVVFDVVDGTQEAGEGGTSLLNRAEADEVCKVLRLLFRNRSPAETGSVVVLSPYRAQVRPHPDLSAWSVAESPRATTDPERHARHSIDDRRHMLQVDLIRGMLPTCPGVEGPADDGAWVQVRTVDAFQGKEADVVALTCVRAPPRRGMRHSRVSAHSEVGFLEDPRRMNVALTRARRSLWVFCNVQTLQGSEPWREFVDRAAKRDAVRTAPPQPGGMAV